MEDCEEILTEEGPSEADKLSNIRQAIENIKKQMKGSYLFVSGNSL